MNDEDWFDSEVAYSNTVQEPLKGQIGYGTIDAGFNIFRGTQHKFGLFAGYNHYQELKGAYGCRQIAIDPNSICLPGDTVPHSVLAITENDDWDSLRAGANAEILVTPRLKLDRRCRLSALRAFSGPRYPSS